MKRSVLVLSLVLVSLAIFAQTAPPKPEYFLIHEEHVRPAALMQYETATRDIINAFTEKKADPKTFGMNLYATTDFTYIYVVPIANWAALDTFQDAWNNLSVAIGKDRWQDLMKRSNGGMYSYSENVVVRRPDLSYEPANPRLKMDEHRFAHLIFYYIDPARMEEAEQVAKDYAALFKAKNIRTPFTTFQALTGEDLPLLVVSVPAKSAADYYSDDEAVMATLGKDVLPLQTRALTVTRKYETRDAVNRPELSYPPGPMAK